MNDTGVQVSPYDHKQSLHLCKESILHCQRGSEHSNICFGKILSFVFLSRMTELKSVDYLQIFLNPPKLFIFLYLLAFLSCPVILYTSMASAHSVFHFCSAILVLPIFCPSVTFSMVSFVSKKWSMYVTFIKLHLRFKSVITIQLCCNYLTLPFTLTSLFVISSFSSIARKPRILFKIPFSNFAHR